MHVLACIFRLEKPLSSIVLDVKENVQLLYK